MLNAPRLLLLDEPTASIDPASARDLRQLIREIAAGGDSGILWTSTNMYQGEAVCDRVLSVSHGRVLLQGYPPRLPHANGLASLEDKFITLAHDTLDSHAGSPT